MGYSVRKIKQTAESEVDAGDHCHHVRQPLSFIFGNEGTAGRHVLCDLDGDRGDRYLDRRHDPLQRAGDLAADSVYSADRHRHRRHPVERRALMTAVTSKKAAWLALVIGGVMETIWAVAMKFSEGFTNIPYAIVTIAFILISLVFLSKGIEGGIPIGTAYAVWVGIGAVGSVIAGIALLGDPAGLVQMLFIIMIIAGIIGLQITSGKKEEDNS